MTRLLVVEGDGIGPEVVEPTVEVLEATVDGLDAVRGEAGREALAEHGQPLAPDTRTLVEDERVDGVLFGATETRPGDPSAVLALREAAGSRVSVRPARARGAQARPCEVTVYRELTEGLYAQRERREDGTAHATRPITREATERFARIALTHAPAEPAPLVAHKATVLPETDGLFLDAVQDVADALEVALEPRLVDALAHDLAVDPGGPATVLAPNLYGDLLSDLAAGLAGGLGLAPSLALGDGVPIAEPVHGTAPDLAGRGLANPSAALLSAAMLLDALGHEQAAWRLEVAVDRALDDPEARPPDVGGSGSTATFVEAVRDQLGVPA